MPYGTKGKGKSEQVQSNSNATQVERDNIDRLYEAMNLTGLHYSGKNTRKNTERNHKCNNYKRQKNVGLKILRKGGKVLSSKAGKLKKKGNLTLRPLNL